MKKKPKSLLFFSIIVIFLIFLISPIFFLFLNIYQLANSGKKLSAIVFENKTQDFNKNFDIFTKQTKNLNKKVNLLKPLVKILPLKYREFYVQIQEYFNLALDLNEVLPELLGQNGERTYFVLLQNPFELRPSGGFMGSYAKLKFSNGCLNSFTVQDIYVPDGQIEGHVDPPWPILETFKHGFWKLRDSNWDPDFPTAIKQVSWFFEKGKEEKADGFVAINFLVIKDLLDIVGPIQMTDYDYTVDSKNFYQIAQNEAERDFFPGSTQKKDFLSALSKEIFVRLQNLKEKQKIKLLKTILKNLKEKQILLNFQNTNLTNFVNKYNWGGLVKRQYLDSKTNIADYIYLVETNLGSNKANCCIQKQVMQNINLDNKNIKENLKIIYKNSSTTTGQRPPLFWGGVYKNFLRVILPIEVNDIKIKIDNKKYTQKVEIKEDEKTKLKTVGFFVTVEPLSEVTVEIEYIKPVSNSAKNYLLEIQKQSGIESYLHTIKLNTATKKITENLEIKTDKLIELDLK